MYLVDPEERENNDQAFERELADGLGRAVLADRRVRPPQAGNGETVIVITMLLLLGAYLIGSFFDAWMPALSHLR